MRNLTPLETLERMAFGIGIFVLLVFLLASTKGCRGRAEFTVQQCVETCRPRTVMHFNSGSSAAAPSCVCEDAR